MFNCICSNTFNLPVFNFYVIFLATLRKGLLFILYKLKVKVNTNIKGLNMQFYIIHNVPRTSSKQLPDYALKSVNLREGWQGLSDIGHAVGVTWEGQNKAYNITHPNTMRYYKNRDDFKEFFENYVENLIEYEIRFKKSTVWHERIANVPYQKLINAIPESDDKYQTVIRYMLNHKSKHLTEDEINRLGEKIENNNQIRA